MLLFFTACTPITNQLEKKHKEEDMILFQKDSYLCSRIAFIEPSSGSEAAQRLKMKECFYIPKEDFITKDTKTPYLSASDPKRFQQLEKAIKGSRPFLWCLRGGYGSARLYPFLKDMTLPKSPKILIGYSDATFLHLYFHQKGWKTIHASMPIDCCSAHKNKIENFNGLYHMMKKTKGVVTYPNLVALNLAAKKSNSIQGVTIGGNLTLVLSSLGTPWQLDGKGKIIFLEDNNGKGYAVDRTFLQLLQSGIFKDAKAVVLGEFSPRDACDHPLALFAETLNIPVFKASFFGHGKTNLPIPFGVTASVSANKKGHTLLISYDFLDTFYTV